jgi:uncharacterized membrane protein
VLLAALACTILSVSDSVASRRAVGAGAGAALAAYRFTTLDSIHDQHFNELLGINAGGQIAGFYGSGTPGGHIYVGYLLFSPYRAVDYHDVLYPGPAPTQLTGLNDTGTTTGFWTDHSGDRIPFYAAYGHFHDASFPAAANRATPRIAELLAFNDAGVGVGFSTDASNHRHAYTYTAGTGAFHELTFDGADSAVASGINNHGDVAGSFTYTSRSGNGATEGFIERCRAAPLTLSYPLALSTWALGINDEDQVVGDYLTGTGAAAVTHGFLWSPGQGYETLQDPSGPSNTVLSDISDNGTIVGYYTAQDRYTHGLLAAPQ